MPGIDIIDQMRGKGQHLIKCQLSLQQFDPIGLPSCFLAIVRFPFGVAGAWKFDVSRSFGEMQLKGAKMDLLFS